MTTNKRTRATSTLSPVPDMLRTPLSSTSVTRERHNGRLRVTVRKELKAEIDRCLHNDRQAIIGARNKKRNSIRWDMLEPQYQQQKLEAATQKVIQRRNDRGQHVSNSFPVFVDFVPIIGIHGKPGKRELDSQQKDDLAAEQIELLIDQYVRMRAKYEDDEEEDPIPVKMQEDEDVQEFRDITPHHDIPSGRFTKRELSDGRDGKIDRDAKTMSESYNIATNPSLSSDVSDRDDEDDSDSESELSSEPDSDVEDDSDFERDDEEELKEEKAPMVAVSRCLPLLKDNPTPVKASGISSLPFANTLSVPSKQSPEAMPLATTITTTKNGSGWRRKA